MPRTQRIDHDDLRSHLLGVDLDRDFTLRRQERRRLPAGFRIVEPAHFQLRSRREMGRQPRALARPELGLAEVFVGADR